MTIEHETRGPAIQLFRSTTPPSALPGISPARGEIGSVGAASDLPPCGGDGRQAREGSAGHKRSPTIASKCRRYDKSALDAVRTTLAAVTLAGLALAPSPASAEPTAKQIFGSEKAPSAMATESFGFYSKGCLAGAASLPVDGPTWQAMRLSRNRHYGHPALVSYLERLSSTAARSGIWPGLLIGDMSQPRGGPMPSGHASHQIGLDADIWFRPMPQTRLTATQRETYPFRSVLKKGSYYKVDDTIWNDHYTNLLKLAASDPLVQRIFVNPGIKRKLCETVAGDRRWMNKIRPFYGHDEHFHVRLFCQPGSVGCTAQASTGKGDGCDELDYWFDVALKPPKPPKPGARPPRPKPPMMLADMPKACRAVAMAPSMGGGGGAALAAMTSAPTASSPAASPSGLAYAPSDVPAGNVPIPSQRPLR